MKRVLTALIVILLTGTWPVFAHSPSVPSQENVKNLDDYVIGAKFDAPNIIKLTENLSVGAEVSKDLQYTNAKEGWTAFGKVTWSGSFLDFSKK